jgi:hypothetical protein
MWRPAASSLGNESGMGSAAWAWTTTRSANPPPRAGRASTREPAAGDVTPAPTSSTTPPTSSPGVIGIGGFCWYLPWSNRTSGKFRAQASTRTTT